MKNKISLIICSLMLVFSFNVSIINAQETKSSNELVRVMVLLEEQPRGLNENAQRYKKQQDLVKQKISEVTNPTYRRSFNKLINGFSVTIPKKDIETVSKIKGVASVRESVTYYPTMQNAVKLTQALKTAQEYDVRGEGLVVSIVDTGIDPAHQDMRLTDPSKAKIKTVAPANGGTPLTQKVPYGYNFADENYIIKDAPGKSMHGMHVAGIVAANGGADANVSTNGRINGVAPEAQLLAMKVFSNHPDMNGAQDDDIAAAIEDSVAKGADIINMSLGSSNGFNTESVGVQKAIANATKAGVLVVVAAGNDGLSHSANLAIDNQLETQDSGAFSSPSASPDALSIASMENSYIVADKAILKQGSTEEEFAYSLATGQPDGIEHEVVAAGLGKAEDFAGKDVSGKYVLIQRGEITFTDKFNNALGKGALGVLVYNNVSNPDETISMAGLDGITNFGTSLSRAVGEKISAAIAKGTTTVKFTHEKMLKTNAEGGKPSEFTSWGPTPDLEFKPQLSAPGGNIYSTLQDNSYGVQSGTSMATPHVAGASALAIQKLATTLPNLNSVERLNFIKQSFMNTAVPMEEEGVPYSIRRQGAGLLQLANALDNRVTVTNDNKASVALYEVENGRTFEVTLKNYSDQRQEFTIQPQRVIKEVLEAGIVKTQFAQSASVSASSETVAIEPNATATVSFTINTGEISDSYIEGFVKFTSKNASQPNLAIPYLGFVGNWGQEQIIATPVYDNDGKKFDAVDTYQTAKTLLYTEIKSNGIAISDAAGLVMSPNGDGYGDILYPKVALLRNAQELRFDIVKDTNHDEVIKQLWKENYATRPVLGQLNAGKSQVRPLKEAKFDGHIYNPHTEQDEILSDGRYAYRLAARINKQEDFQYTYIPFVIDTIAPQISDIVVLPAENNLNKIRFKFTESGSGIKNITVYTLKGATLTITATDTPDVYEAILPADAECVSIIGFDNALNMAEEIQIVTNRPFAAVSNYADFATKVLTNSSEGVTNGTITLTGFVNGDIRKVSINGTTAVVQDGLFTLNLPLTEGTITPVLKGLGPNDEELFTKKLDSLTYDAIPPELTFTKPQNETDLVQAQDGKFVIKGKVSDNLGFPQVLVNGATLPLTANGEFTYEVPVSTNVDSVSFVASDGGNIVTKTIRLANPNPQTQPLSVTIDGVNINELQKFVSEDPNYNSATKEYSLKGTFNRKPKQFYINNELIPVNDDLTFTKKITLNGNLTQVNFKLVDTDDSIKFDYGVRFYVDESVPELHVKTPTIINDKVYTNSDRLEINGTLKDEGFGYTFHINDNLVERSENLSFTNSEQHEREFSFVLNDVQTNDLEKLRVVDLFGNTITQDFRIVVDKELPVITVTNLEENEQVTSGKQITITTTDNELLTVNNVSLNGETIENEFNTEDLTSGIYLLKVTAQDAAGNIATKEIAFAKINKPELTIPENLSIEYGTELNAKALKITASDKEDGDLTNEIEVVSENFDSTKPGTYSVLVRVEDSDENEKVIKVNVVVKPKPEDLVLIDPATNIKLTAVHGVLPDDTRLVVTKLEKQRDGYLGDYYDITLVSNGAVVQPKNFVVVEVPYEAKRKDFVEVKHVLNDEYLPVAHRYDEEKNIASFLTDHFSTYFVGETKEAETLKPQENPSEDNPIVENTTPKEDKNSSEQTTQPSVSTEQNNSSKKVITAVNNKSEIKKVATTNDQRKNDVDTSDENKVVYIAILAVCAFVILRMRKKA